MYIKINYLIVTKDIAILRGNIDFDFSKEGEEIVITATISEFYRRRKLEASLNPA